MMTWGPQAHGGAAAPNLKRGGGWLWWFPVLWAFTFPAWLIGLLASIGTPVGFACPGTKPSDPQNCPDVTRPLIAGQMQGFGDLLLWAFILTGAIGVWIGWLNGRRATRPFYARPYLTIAAFVVSLPQAIAYLIGYFLGRLPRTGRPKSPSKRALSRTESHQLIAAPNTVAAITDRIAGRTGKLPGAVLGWSLDGSDTLVTAPPRGGVLVLGPPGSGKTSAVLIPSVLIAPGACVSSSIKSDIMIATAPTRAGKGRVWHFDPGGDEITPPGIEPVRWSPLVSVRSWDDALQVGQTMAEPLFQGGNGGNDRHFIGRATDWVQTLLYAAHLGALPIAAVARWALSAADEDTQTEIVTILGDAEADGDEGAGIAVQKLLGLIATPDKERGSIISTMVGLLRVYDSVSARKVGDNPNFDPRTFVESNDTLYITARPDKQSLYAPLLAALLEQIRFETYDRTKREQAGLEQVLPHVTFALDEANTTAPIPLPAIISEAGGQGLHIIVGIQALGPAVARWGDAARSFLTLFPTKVIFRGVFDKDTVSALSSASGEYDRQMTSYSVSTSYLGKYSLPIQQVTPSYTAQRQQVLTEGDITSIPRGRALVWDGPTWGLLGIGMHWNTAVWQAVSGQVLLPTLPSGSN
ncbi:type IV secretory system conjugative DNA transfer family protein [Frondihabitans cladoniiphilus]|uniref:Type IV secretory system conjugative DNA transfer VirD4/TraG family protein n=1 Tax=Frondihabitans cladoniiphilus TaxID=715785 RepID=A0ABP8WD68_9MICO